jgi:arylsulfatase A-like enzyme
MHKAWAFALCCPLLACVQSGSGERATQLSTALPEQSHAPSATPASAKSEPIAKPIASAAASTSGGERAVYYDLTSAPERAELREDGALVIDFGERAGAKYSYGGWLSGTGRNQRIEGSSTLLVPEKVARLALPAEGTGAALLAMRVRGFTAGPLTVYVNGSVAADAKLTGKGFQVLSVPVRAGMLHAGDNQLQLRVGKTRAALGLPETGLALDWMRLLPASATAVDRAPPSLAQLRDDDAQASRLRVPAGYALGFGLEVPKAGALRLRARGEGSAQLGVWAVRDDKPALMLAETPAGAKAAPLDVDLSQIGGEFARLELRARGGDVVLEQAVVVRGDAAAAAAQAKKPIRNVILMLIDTLRADKLSAYRAQSRVKAPGMDAFVRNAAVMENARSQENWTKPSVATLLSSLLPWQHEAVDGDSKLPESVEIIPEVLGKRGFYTGAFITNGYCSDKFGFKQGWRTYRNYIREGRPNIAQYVAADVLDWLDERPKDKPFFLYVHTIDPHEPYKPPANFLRAYDAQPYSGPVDFKVNGDILERIKLGRIKPNDRDKERLEALYDAEISYHDVHFAAMMQGLEKRGLAEDTLVIVTADHGEEFWDHGSIGHGHSVYDELLHVPLIVRLPGVTDAGMRVPDAVGLVDVMPTILDALGQPIPSELVGRSFLPMLQGRSDKAPRAAVSGFFRAWRTLGVGRYKLIQHGTERATLYDVHADPGEKTDLAAERPLLLAYTRGLLGLTLAEDAGDDDKTRAARTHKSATTKIDAKTDAQLRALGYVGGAARPQ